MKIDESYVCFQQRHSRYGDPIRCGSWIVFEDGAVAHAENCECRSEPCTDNPQELLRVRRDYHQEWAARLRNERNRLVSLNGLRMGLPEFEREQPELLREIEVHETIVKNLEKKITRYNEPTQEFAALMQRLAADRLAVESEKIGRENRQRKMTYSNPNDEAYAVVH